MDILIHAGAEEPIVFSGIADEDGTEVPLASLAAMTHTLRIAVIGGATVLEQDGTATDDGEVTVTLSETDTATLSGSNHYQLITDNAGDTDVTAEGLIVATSLLEELTS